MAAQLLTMVVMVVVRALRAIATAVVNRRGPVHRGTIHGPGWRVVHRWRWCVIHRWWRRVVNRAWRHVHRRWRHIRVAIHGGTQAYGQTDAAMSLRSRTRHQACNSDGANGQQFCNPWGSCFCHHNLSSSSQWALALKQPLLHAALVIQRMRYRFGWQDSPKHCDQMLVDVLCAAPMHCLTSVLACLVCEAAARAAAQIKGKGARQASTSRYIHTTFRPWLTAV